MGPTNFGITAWQRLRHSVVRWRTQKREILQELRVCLPAIVQTFYPITQTVDVVIATNEYVWFTDSSAGPPNPNSPTLPPPINMQTQAPQWTILKGIPIFIQNGGSLMLTFPIQAGDECDVIFHDVPISGWWQNGGLNNLPFDQRRHNLSDGIAYFGPRSKPNVIPNYSTTKAQLRNLAGDTFVEVDSSGNITVTATQNVTINATGTVTINGGSVIISSNTQIDGTVYLSHVHSGVMSGGSDTGPVVP